MECRRRVKTFETRLRLGRNAEAFFWVKLLARQPESLATRAGKRLSTAIAKKLPFKCEIMICPAKEVLDLVRKDPFARQPSGPDITRFVNVLHKPLRKPPPLPLSLPSDDEWLLRVIAIQGRFVLGLYRRQMKAISYLGKIEKTFGVPATVRNWNTIEKTVKILS